MAHFAEIDGNNIILRVIVVDDANEAGGEAWCNNLLGGTWVKTSYNTHGGSHPRGNPFRKNFAAVGDVYDEGRDAFYGPQPYPSWVLNEQTALWKPPTPQPARGQGQTQAHTWNEQTLTWDAPS